MKNGGAHLSKQSDDMWLIIGKNGQLGHCLSDLLCSKSVEHLSLSRSDLDITNAKDVENVLSQIRPSIVVNTAAFTAVDNAEDCEETAYLVNAVGPENIARACSMISARFIHISTDYVFRGDSTTPYEIDSPRKPLNVYGQTKLAGENAVSAYSDGKFSILRTAWLYSEYGKNFAKTMAQRAVNSEPSIVVSDQFGQPTSAHDLSSLIFELGQLTSMPQIVHGTNSGIASWYEFAVEIYHLLGADTSLVTETSSRNFVSRAKRPAFTALNNNDFSGSPLHALREWKTSLQYNMSKIVSEIQTVGNL